MKIKVNASKRTLAIMGSLAFATTPSFFLIGCDTDDGTVEEAGESIDETLDEAGDAVDETADEVDDAVDG